jgi:TetR/AcrR family transcriptional regulator, transcriptional repressor for nem operon
MRDQVLDAVERLLYDSGYAAVTYRAVAARAGITPSLVQYYFPALDELLVATVRRRSEQSLRRLVTMLRDRPTQPVRVVWEFSNDETNAKLTIEFSALANHRESVRAEIVDHTNRLRAIQLEALGSQELPQGLVPAAALFLISGIPKLIRMEEDFDVDVGHAEVLDLVNRWLDDLEPSTP